MVAWSMTQPGQFNPQTFLQLFVFAFAKQFLQRGSIRFMLQYVM